MSRDHVTKGAARASHQRVVFEQEAGAHPKMICLDCHRVDFALWDRGLCPLHRPRARDRVVTKPTRVLYRYARWCRYLRRQHERAHITDAIEAIKARFDAERNPHHKTSAAARAKKLSQEKRHAQ